MYPVLSKSGFKTLQDEKESDSYQYQPSFSVLQSLVHLVVQIFERFLPKKS